MLPPSNRNRLSTELTRPVLVLGGLFLAGLWFVLCRHLSDEWTVNEQYNYGWFVPFFALFLFWLRWEARPAPEIGDRRRTWVAALIVVSALLLLLPVRVFEIGNPDWRPLSWFHAGIVVAITLFAVWFAGGRPWLRHFAFPIVFFLVAVPWITPIEVPIIQGLMRFVAGFATEAVALLGIPAELDGNLIRINNGLVGVNEACSGVRSFQTSLMIGLLFGELKRLSIFNRVALVAGAIAIAVVANLGRATFLVWIAATKNISEVDRWHDLAGYAIVGIVFVGSMFLAGWLARQQRSQVDSPSGRSSLVTRHFFRLPNFYFLIPAVIWIALVEIGAASWYRAHETNLAATARWDVRWPESAPNFHELKIQQAIKNTLRFDDGREVAWREEADSAKGGLYLLYFFRWEPGTSTVLRARAHRPDICLPSAGWRQTADEGTRMYSVTDKFAVPFHHFAFTREGTVHSPPVYAHAFFCLREDTVRPGEASQLSKSNPGDWSRSERWRVVREGIRNPGQQVMEFLMVSPHQRSSAEAAERFERLLPELIKVEDRK